MDWFNQSRDFISTEILKEESPVARTNLIEKFIQIGQVNFSNLIFFFLIQKLIFKLQLEIF